MNEIDYVLCECALSALQELVEILEKECQIEIVKTPTICMTMIEAEDSVELQPFYLGEALTTESELIVDGKIGYGICLGDEPVRSYCIAFVDAYLKKEGRNTMVLLNFIREHNKIIEEERQEEHAYIMRTKVDFKLMEQE
ncbi:MAG: phosphonate C-P lyase system protein PhnG [Chitinophagaceae bacterium]|nr:phosphonate C-P lyase system protein PhnG [Chitinophagaceae bacterium]